MFLCFHRRKNEFRYYINPKYLSKTGKPHTAHISVSHKNYYRFNVITHSGSFFGEKTENGIEIERKQLLPESKIRRHVYAYEYIIYRKGENYNAK